MSNQEEVEAGHQEGTPVTGENTEATIANLQQHDYLDSEKLVKTLSKLREPPDGLALGGDESRRLMKSEEENVRGGLALNSELSSEEEKASMLDPVKAQERASELMQKAEEEKELQKNLDNYQRKKLSERRKTPSSPSSSSTSLTPEDAMNALDGKPLPKINVGDEKPATTDKALQRSESKDPATTTTTTTTSKAAENNESKTETAIDKTIKQTEEPIKHGENTTKTSFAQEPVVNQTATTNATNTQTISNKQETKETKAVVNEIQTPKEENEMAKENPINQKTSEEKPIKDVATISPATLVSPQSVPKGDTTHPLEFETPKKDNSPLLESSSSKIESAPQRDTVVAANATVSSQVVDLLKGIGQIKSAAEAPKRISNSSMEAEEKETKEAVKDLNTAIGILEKKLLLINQAKTSGDKKNIYLLDNEKKERNTAIRSQIDLNNSLKLLEKVMNVAERVKVKGQKKNTDTSIEKSNNKQETRDSIERVVPRPLHEEEYDILKDEKRDKIYRHVPYKYRSQNGARQIKKTNVPRYNRWLNFQSRRSRMVPFYRNPYNYIERSYFTGNRYPLPWYPRY